MNELKKLIEIKKKFLGRICSTRLMTPKKIRSMKFKNMTMVFLERSISNGTTTVENVINNKELLKYATDNLKEL